MSTSKQNSKSKVLPAQCYGYAPLSSVNNFSVKGRDSLLGPMIPNICRDDSTPVAVVQNMAD